MGKEEDDICDIKTKWGTNKDQGTLVNVTDDLYGKIICKRISRHRYRYN